MEFDPDLLPWAINQAQMEIQRGVLVNGNMVQPDWTASERHYVLPYQSGGIVLEDAVMRVRAVYRAHHETTNGEELRGTYLHPTSGESRDNHRESHTSHWNHGDLRSHHGGCETWWIEERRLKLGHSRREIVGDNVSNLRLWLDVFRLVNDLRLPTDENWFTINLWDALAYKAAAIGFQAEFDPKRITMYESMALSKIQSAINADQRFHDGGVADDVIPPRPHLFNQSNARHWEDF